jgi:hypothetical protein
MYGQSGSWNQSEISFWIYFVDFLISVFFGHYGGPVPPYLGALQIFGVNFECTIVYSKVVKNFEVESCPLQIYWSGQLPTPKKLECTLFHSKLKCMK